jgi:hypothetical protein
MSSVGLHTHTSKKTFAVIENPFFPDIFGLCGRFLDQYVARCAVQTTAHAPYTAPYMVPYMVPYLHRTNTARDVRSAPSVPQRHHDGDFQVKSGPIANQTAICALYNPRNRPQYPMATRIEQDGGDSNQ